MDDLRNFLDSRCRKREPANGEESWLRLSKKIMQLKRQGLRDESFILHGRTQEKISMNESSSVSVSVDAAVKHCVEILHKVSKGSKPPFALLPSGSEDLWHTAIQDLTKLNSAKHLSKSKFLNHLFDTDLILPLQLICELQKAGILLVSTFAMKKIYPGKESALSTAVLWLLSNSSNSPEYLNIVLDALSSLLIASQYGPLNSQLSTACSASLKKCIEDIITWVLNLPPSTLNPSEENIDFTYLSCQNFQSLVGVDARERFVLTHLLFLLGENCEPYSPETIAAAVELENRITLDSTPPPLKNLLLSIVRCLGGEKVINQIAAALVKPSVNWKINFLLSAAVVSEYPGCCENLKSVTDNLIRVGLEGGRTVEFTAGFLLARHCCSCDERNFSTYSSWFSSHFGPDSVTAKSAVKYKTLLKLLTDIVPVESAENLRVHINKVPQAPTSCGSFLHDYTILARTRLADLNESAELPGLFSDSKKDLFPGLESRQGDIVRVLLHFQQTHEVIKPVLEASIFRRQYYQNVFLVELLGLRGSPTNVFKPEDFDLGTNIRHEFILTLNSLGKIPEKLFKAYQAKTDPLESNNVETGSKVGSVKPVPDISDPPRRKKTLQVKQKI